MRSSPKKTFKVSEIQFSHATVGANFKDGRSVQGLTEALLSSTISIETIEPIRVVYYKNRYWTLDNRRLRAFKDALISEIPVVICDLSDPKIKQEFFQKLSNKNIDTGGVVRASDFDEKSRPRLIPNNPGWTFINWVLGLTFEQLEEPLPALNNMLPIPKKFDTWQDYFDTFPELVQEEMRASIQGALEKIDEKTPSIDVTLREYKPGKKQGRLSSFVFTLEKTELEIKPGSVVVLVYKEDPKQRFLALSFFRESRIGMPEVFLRADPSDEMSELLNNTQGKQIFTLYSLTAFTPLQRMFEAAINSTADNFFGEALLNGEFNQEDDPTPETLNQPIPGLNPSQARAVNRFVEGSAPLQIIQGPPGTGKTTTIVTAAQRLLEQDSDHTILIATSANKPSQDLLLQFMEKHQDFPVLFLGVEEKISHPKLYEIYLDGWAQRQINQLLSLQDDFLSLNFSMKTIEEYRDKINKFKTTLFAFIEKIGKFTLVKRLLGLENTQTELSEYFSNLDGLLSSGESEEKIKRKISEISQKLSDLVNTIATKSTENGGDAFTAALLRSARVVGATASVAGRSTFKKCCFDIVIVDEATQMTEAEFAILVNFSSKKCLLVGDTRQLSSTVTSKKAEALGFGRSPMQRLVEEGYPSDLLDTQYRTNPKLYHYTSSTYYEGCVTSDPSVGDPSRIPAPLKNLFEKVGDYRFIDVSTGQEMRNGQGSFYNIAEANVIISYLYYLKNYLKMEVSSQVVIITFYKGQVSYLKEMTAKDFPNLTIVTVDSTQGSEYPYTIVSGVRTKDVGFLRDPRRLNVATTRAKYGTMIVGNLDNFDRSEYPHLQKLTEHVRLETVKTGWGKKINEEPVVINADEFTQKIKPPKTNSSQVQTDAKAGHQKYGTFNKSDGKSWRSNNDQTSSKDESWRSKSSWRNEGSSDQSNFKSDEKWTRGNTETNTCPTVGPAPSK